jgi:hypothetical protein
MRIGAFERAVVREDTAISGWAFQDGIRRWVLKEEELDALLLEMVNIARWNCAGAVFETSEDCLAEFKRRREGR